jgi:hypothetical protein
MIGYAAVGGILAFLIVCGFVFARFLSWRDSRDMVKAQREIHHVHQGALAGPYNSAQW